MEFPLFTLLLSALVLLFYINFVLVKHTWQSSILQTSKHIFNSFEQLLVCVSI